MPPDFEHIYLDEDCTRSGARLTTSLELLVTGLGLLFAVYSGYLGTLFIAGGYSVWRGRHEGEAAVLSSTLPVLSVLVAVKN